MSRFGMLVRQFRASDKRLADQADYLVLHAEELAEDFGLWLSQTESGQTDPLCQPIEVKAVGHYLDDEGEPAYNDNLLTGEIGDTLNFALEFKLADVEISKVPSIIRLPLTMVVAEDGVKVSVSETAREFGYKRTRTPEFLFDDLYAICQKTLAV
ncbi:MULTISPECIES: hypothetical protein [Pseudomonas]|uniref:hypothetical protein n=1 Tax=Pseudomonas TaxID=286 RepID=UPI00223496A1|nr:hypothetical protein [Pseudomonas sp. B21-059]UZE36905.1 hypothetical protein LOY69_10570 [Pseudomonas sp. B21-059]